jgi:hypothetical protein
MTGQEFKRLVVMCGTQAAVAKALGIEADTVRARYAEDVVPPIYEHAIIGLALRSKLPQLLEIAEFAGVKVAEKPNESS